MSIAVTALSRQAGKLTELIPRKHSCIYGMGSRGGREQEKRRREILEVGKGSMWQNASESKIRNRDEIRGNIIDGMDKGLAYTERTSE